MKILIYGAKGWIGNQFKNVLESKRIEYYESTIHVDFIVKKDIARELEIVNPTHAISFIGRTRGFFNNKEFKTIDYLEQEGKLLENLRDNLCAPLILKHICKSKNIHFTYIGTGCIFNYLADDNEYQFKELDTPNFFGSSYSTVKGITEQLLNLDDDEEDTALCLRIRMPITDRNEPQNFITKLASYERICSIPNSMTVLPELLPYIIDLMEMEYCGVLNFTNPGVISHNEILELYKEYVDPSFTWKNFTIEEQNKILFSKRSNTHLDTRQLRFLFPAIKNIKDSVRDMMKHFKK
jgi:3,5-epimerase/4-reductase